MVDELTTVADCALTVLELRFETCLTVLFEFKTIDSFYSEAPSVEVTDLAGVVSRTL